MKTRLLLLILVAFSYTANAQLYWNFTATNGTTASTVPTGWTVTAVTRGNTVQGSISATNAPNGGTTGSYTEQSAGNNMSIQTIPGSAALGTSTYFEVTITPSATEKVQIMDIRFGGRSVTGGNKSTQIVIKSSVDGYATALGTAVDPEAGKWHYYSTNLSAELSAEIGVAITIRLYTDGSAGTQDSAFRLDDLYIIGPVGSVLPVTLTSFTGKPTVNGPQLTWQTASEENSSHFEILRSSNSTDFKSIGTVTAAINSTTAKNYTFVDGKTAAGTNYYQLKQVDNDGNFKVYPTVIAVETALSKADFTTVLSAEKQELAVNVNAIGANKGTIKIYSVGGQLVASKDVVFTEGFNKFTFATGNLANGVYIANVNIGSQKLSKKFIK